MKRYKSLDEIFELSHGKTAALIASGSLGVAGALHVKDKYVDEPKRTRKRRHIAADDADKAYKKYGKKSGIQPIFKDADGRRYRYLGKHEIDRMEKNSKYKKR